MSASGKSRAGRHRWYRRPVEPAPTDDGVGELYGPELPSLYGPEREVLRVIGTPPPGWSPRTRGLPGPTRASCPDLSDGSACPWLACRHHAWPVRDRAGRPHPGHKPKALVVVQPISCALQAAEQRPRSADEIAGVLGYRDRRIVELVLASAIAKLQASADAQTIATLSGLANVSQPDDDDPIFEESDAIDPLWIEPFGEGSSMTVKLTVITDDGAEHPIDVPIAIARDAFRLLRTGSPTSAVREFARTTSASISKIATGSDDR